MANEILPSIGAKGAWNLKAPYNSLLIADLEYECKAIRKLSELLTTGVDVFTLYYDNVGVNKTVFDDHVKNDYSIISMVSTSGKWLFIPSPFINGWPDSNVVPYVVMGLLANLGPIPNTLNPTFLIDKVKNVIQANIGLTPTVQFITLSEPKNKSWLDHDSLETLRLSNITDTSTDYVRRLKAEDDLEKALLKINQLETWIKNNP